MGLDRPLRRARARAGARSEAYPTVAHLEALEALVAGHGRAFLARLRDVDLAREVTFAFPGVATSSLPVGQLLHHALAHGIHHRGQVALLLRMRGIAADDLDFLFYRIQQRATAPPPATTHEP